MAWVLVAGLFGVGMWALIAERNLVRKVIGLSFANTAVTVLYVLLAAERGSAPPILSRGAVVPVDPIPHALMLTAIVVGVCVVALAVVLVQRLYLRFGTLDLDELEQRIWGNDGSASHGPTDGERDG